MVKSAYEAIFNSVCQLVCLFIVFRTSHKISAQIEASTIQVIEQGGFCSIPNVLRNRKLADHNGALIRPIFICKGLNLLPFFLFMKFVQSREILLTCVLLCFGLPYFLFNLFSLSVCLLSFIYLNKLLFHCSTECHVLLILRIYVFVKQVDSSDTHISSS